MRNMMYVADPQTEWCGHVGAGDACDYCCTRTDARILSAAVYSAELSVPGVDTQRHVIDFFAAEEVARDEEGYLRESDPTINRTIFLFPYVEAPVGHPFWAALRSRIGEEMWDRYVRPIKPL